MQFSSPILSPKFLWNTTVKAVQNLRNYLLQVKTVSSGYQHIKYHNHDPSEIFQGVGPYHNHQWISYTCFLGIEQIQMVIPRDDLKGKPIRQHYQVNGD